ncbi:MAG TPA: hypothetical protein VKS60_20885, partial [Stellaceae bacterium]|nr:hypothetical protein [Stellaceae bacterium]
MRPSARATVAARGRETVVPAEFAWIIIVRGNPMKLGFLPAVTIATAVFMTASARAEDAQL